MAALIALHGFLALSATLKKSATFDEPLHIAAGTSYWLRNDYRLQPENGNLPQRLIGLPLALSDFKLPPETEQAWSRSEGFQIADEYIFGPANDRDAILFRARAAITFASCLLAFGVFLLARRLWGRAGGFLALTAYALSPTMLAHGGLATSDLVSAAWFLAALVAILSMFRAVTPGRILFAGLACGALALSKYSAVLIAPVIIAAALWLSCRNGPLLVWTSRGLRAVRNRLPKFAWLTGALLLTAVIAWATIWAAYGFRYQAGNPAAHAFVSFFKPDSMLILESKGTDAGIASMDRAHLFPQSFLYGLRFVLKHAEARSAYFMGEWSGTGWPMFFPVAFLIKTPLGSLLLMASGLAACVVGIARKSSGPVVSPRTKLTVSVLAGFVATYVIAAVTSHLNIGHRHLLPIYPVLFVLLGALLHRRLPLRGARAAVSVLGVAILAVESFAIRPDYLAFFNASIGGPSEGHRYLVDSSLDWGQDLPGLRDWLAGNDLLNNPRSPVYLSYFGAGNPASYGIHAFYLPTYFLFKRPPFVPELEGGIYAISTTMFEGLYAQWAGPWTPSKENRYQQLRAKLRTPDGQAVHGSGVSPDIVLEWEQARFARLCLYLRTVEPDTVIGHTINIFRLSDAQVHLAIDGSREELIADIERRTGIKLE